MTTLHLHIIANEHAGSGKAKNTLENVQLYLNETAIPHTIYKSTYPGHAIEIAKGLLKEQVIYPWNHYSHDPYPLLVVLGGDGSIHEVVNALNNQFDIPIAYIPSGSGNDFARSVNIPREPIEALKYLLSKKEPQSVNVLKIRNNFDQKITYVTNNLGIGLDASIVVAANQSSEKKLFNHLKLGSLIYIFYTIRMLLKQKGFPLQVSVAEQTTSFTKAYLTTCTNHPYFGGGVKIIPTASAFDGNVDLIVVEKIALFKILYLISQLMKQTHMSSKFVNHFKGKEIRIKTPSKEYGQMNGEPMEKQPFDVTATTIKRLFWL